MKQVVLILAIITMASCKKPNHSVRIKNDYIYEWHEVTFGTASFDTVKVGYTTDYQPINTGKLNLHGYGGGSKGDSLDLFGSQNISGTGTHRWTIHFQSVGKLVIHEDE